MKPLPAAKSQAAKPTPADIPSLPSALSGQPPSYSKTNRRASNPGSYRIYPWLLSSSTLLAGVFCFLYITKPVIVPASLARTPNALAPTTTAAATTALSKPESPPHPHAKVRPTAATPREALATRPAPSAFEETNLRVQHILTAEAPGGHLDRIDIDVPVLYHSRQLRWTPAEVAQARSLLNRLMNYQEKTLQLRAEGAELLDAWNALVSQSIPGGDLRADSPSLPANQEDAAAAPRPAGLTTTDAIEIETSKP